MVLYVNINEFLGVVVLYFLLKQKVQAFTWTSKLFLNLTTVAKHQ